MARLMQQIFGNPDPEEFWLTPYTDDGTIAYRSRGPGMQRIPKRVRNKALKDLGIKPKSKPKKKKQPKVYSPQGREDYPIHEERVVPYEEHGGSQLDPMPEGRSDYPVQDEQVVPYEEHGGTAFQPHPRSRPSIYEPYRGEDQGQDYITNVLPRYRPGEEPTTYTGPLPTQKPEYIYEPNRREAWQRDYGFTDREDPSEAFHEDMGSPETQFSGGTHEDDGFDPMAGAEGYTGPFPQEKPISGFEYTPSPDEFDAGGEAMSDYSPAKNVARMYHSGYAGLHRWPAVIVDYLTSPDMDKFDPAFWVGYRNLINSMQPYFDSVGVKSGTNMAEWVDENLTAPALGISYDDLKKAQTKHPYIGMGGEILGEFMLAPATIASKAGKAADHIRLDPEGTGPTGPAEDIRLGPEDEGIINPEDIDIGPDPGIYEAQFSQDQPSFDFEGEIFSPQYEDMSIGPASGKTTVDGEVIDTTNIGATQAAGRYDDLVDPMPATDYDQFTDITPDGPTSITDEQKAVLINQIRNKPQATVSEVNPYAPNTTGVNLNRDEVIDTTGVPVVKGQRPVIAEPEFTEPGPNLGEGVEEYDVMSDLRPDTDEVTDLTDVPVDTSEIIYETPPGTTPTLDEIREQAVRENTPKIVEPRTTPKVVEDDPMPALTDEDVGGAGLTEDDLRPPLTSGDVGKKLKEGDVTHMSERAKRETAASLERIAARVNDRDWNEWIEGQPSIESFRKYLESQGIDARLKEGDFTNFSTPQQATKEVREHIKAYYEILDNMRYTYSSLLRDRADIAAAAREGADIGDSLAGQAAQAGAERNTNLMRRNMQLLSKELLPELIRLRAGIAASFRHTNLSDIKGGSKLQKQLEELDEAIENIQSDFAKDREALAEANEQKALGIPTLEEATAQGDTTQFIEDLGRVASEDDPMPEIDRYLSGYEGGISSQGFALKPIRARGLQLDRDDPMPSEANDEVSRYLGTYNQMGIKPVRSGKQIRLDSEYDPDAVRMDQLVEDSAKARAKANAYLNRSRTAEDDPMPTDTGLTPDEQDLSNYGATMADEQNPMPDPEPEVPPVSQGTAQGNQIALAANQDLDGALRGINNVVKALQSGDANRIAQIQNNMPQILEDLNALRDGVIKRMNQPGIPPQAVPVLQQKLNTLEQFLAQMRGRSPQ